APYPNPFGVEGGVAAFAPKYQANIIARYDWTMGEYHPWVSIDGNYVSEQWNEPENYISGEDPSQIVPTTTYLRYKIPGYGLLGCWCVSTGDKWPAHIGGQTLRASPANPLSSPGHFTGAAGPRPPRVVTPRVGMRF